MVFDVSLERPGPGSASTFDPALTLKGETPAISKETNVKLKIIARHLNAGKDSSFLRSIHDALPRYQKSINRWQAIGGFDSPIGRLARSYISGGTAEMAKIYEDIIADGQWATSSLSRTAMDIVDLVRSSEVNSTPIFRGLGNTKPIEQFENAKPGDIMRLESPSSFTEDFHFAYGIGKINSKLNKHGYLLKITGKHRSLKVQQHEDFNSEAERVTHGKFRVLGKNVDKNGIVVITIRQLEVN